MQLPRVVTEDLVPMRLAVAATWYHRCTCCADAEAGGPPEVLHRLPHLLHPYRAARRPHPRVCRPAPQVAEAGRPVSWLNCGAEWVATLPIRRASLASR